MKKIDEHIKKEILDCYHMIIVSSFFSFLGIIGLKNIFSIDITEIYAESFMYVITIIIFALICIIVSVFGIVFLVYEIRKLNKQYIRLKEVRRLELENRVIYAHIDGEKANEYGYSSIICSAEVNGCECQFISDKPVFDAFYAAKELGVEEVKVYTSIQNPNEYVVDLRDLEERVVDLT